MRKMVPLSPRLDGKLESYVAAAKAESHQVFTAAAAVGLASLSIALALNAEVVYTPTNERVGGVRTGLSTLQIDLNNDGIADFVLEAYNVHSSSSGVRIINTLDARGLKGNQILEASQYFAAASAPGQIIGSLSARARFRTTGLMASYRLGASEFTYHKTSEGFWLNATNRYLGIKFYINGEIHYGWARLNAHAGYAQLTGYAYETEPNTPIRTLGGIYNLPPGSLGGLAGGATQQKK